MRCPHCRSSLLMEIAMAMAGVRFTMHSCPSCEARWWDRDGDIVALDRVLTTVGEA